MNINAIKKIILLIFMSVVCTGCFQKFKNTDDKWACSQNKCKNWYNLNGEKK